ncbi:MAG: hypothetical protein P1V20_22140 [Verrucomicrobiales bacterium]|nr:hypothetical protein [Verrucomicrobiales bacterium]
MQKIFHAAFIVAAVFSLSQSAQAQKVDFEKQVWPIIEAKCVECHREPYEENGRLKKPKGGLRLDGAWAIMMGGEGGATVDPGKSDHSELFARVTLPEDDDDFMPPTGKADPLTDKEKELLAKWIDEGADFGGWAGNLKGKPAEVSNAGGKIPVSEIQELYKKLSEGVSPLKEDAWKDITASGGRVMPLSNSSPLLSVDYRLTAEDATDDKFAAIKAISDHVAHLDLSRTQVTDATMSDVSKMDRLVRLDLHQTAISDEGLSHLKGLKNLRYINLYGTQVSDAGLNQLKSMKSLRAVYLWNSNATPKGAKALRAALPDAKINID